MQSKNTWIPVLLFWLQVINNFADNRSWAIVADSDTTLNQQRDKSMCVLGTLNAIPFNKQTYIYLKGQTLSMDV